LTDPSIVAVSGVGGKMNRQALFMLMITAWAVAMQPDAHGQESRSMELNVFAAASLTECFNALAKQYEALDADVRISFNFGGSQQLSQQINQGAPADIFVSANMKQMTEAAKSGRIDSSAPKFFAHNRLVVVCPKENVAGLRSLRDLAKPHLKIILADKAVPVGQYSLDFLGKCTKSTSFDSAFRTEVLRNVVSYEENVKVVLSKIILGEADAGIVYSSDISEHIRQDVETIEIPDEFNVVATYPVAVVRDSKHLAHAQKFMEFLLSGDGQAILARFGFIPITSKGPGR
jgi:molybdate transport system substrate-binding protein